MIAGGEARPGMEILVQPSGQRTRIASIVTANGELDRAGVGQSVTLTLTDDVDVSRGDLIAEASAPAHVSDRLNARIFWMGQGTGAGTLAPGGRYHIKLGTASAAASIAGPMQLIDLGEDAAVKSVDRLMSNEFGTCRLELDRPLAADGYNQNRETGSFILIDAETHDTVAMGLIEVPAIAATATRSASAMTAVPMPRDLYKLFGINANQARSLAKTLSWRVMGSVVTFLVVLLVTGNSAIASSLLAPWGRS
jgi:sulfate adenylyltransferase subunit 1 (EFTu-like GTPase family)